MRRKLSFVLIPFLLILLSGVGAMASGMQTYEDLSITIDKDVVLSDTVIKGTLTLDNKTSGTVSLVNCNINKLVLNRSETADAPAIIIDGSSNVSELTLLDSASVQSTGESKVSKIVVADKCDAHIAGEAGQVEVAAGAVVTCSGRVDTLLVGESAQVNLTENAYVSKAVISGQTGSALSVLKVDTYAAIDSLEASGQLIVNGTGSVNRLLAKEGSAVDVDVTITGEDSAKTAVQSENATTVNYMDDTLLPMLFDGISSTKVTESKTITLSVKDLLGMPLEPEYTVQSSDTSVISASVSGDLLTLTRKGDGFAIISIAARLKGYLPTHTAFVVNTNKETAAVVETKADDKPVRLELNTGNICNKTLTVGETAEIRGISCNESAVISAASSNPAVAEVSAVSGGAFTVTAKGAGITAITVKATKTGVGKQYLPAVQKFVVTVSDEVKELIQLGIAAPGKDQLTKVYDGSATIHLAGGALSGVLAGDDVLVNVIAVFADAGAGMDKQVNLSYHIYGKNADKYFAPKDATVGYGVITRKPANVFAAVVDRGYVAGQLTVELTNVRVAGLLETDEVRLDSQQAAATMANDGVGASKPVTVAGFRLTGKDRGNYQLTMPRNVTVTIGKGEQSALGITSMTEITYGAEYVLSTAGGSGKGAITFAIVAGGTGAGYVDGATGRLTITRAGTFFLQATKAGDESYLPSMSPVFTLTVHKAEQEQVTITSAGTITMLDSYQLTATGGTGTGAFLYEVVEGGTGQATIDSATGELTLVQAGTILLKATRVADGNYLAESATLTLTVNKAEQAPVSVTSADTITMLDSYQLTATGGSGTGAFLYEVVEGGTGQATIDSATGELTLVQAGTILLRATKAADGDYRAESSPTFTLTVNKAGQAAITITSASGITYGDTYTATASGGTGTGLVTFSVVPGGTGEANVDAATGELTVTKAGTVLLQATKATDVHYLAKSSTVFTLTVAKAAQAALAVTSASSTLISDAYTVTAAGGTGTGAITFSVVAGGTGAATVNASTGVLNLTRAGTVLLQATKATDDNYLAKTSPTFTLTVIKGTQTLTLAPSATSSGAGTQISLNASAQGEGAITYQITGGTSTGSTVNSSGVVTMGTVGTVTVTATVAECESFYTDSESITLTSTPVAPVITAFSASRANSFDGSYRDLGTFTPTIYNPNGGACPLTVTYTITKTGEHGSYVHASATSNTARLAVGTYSITCTATNSEGSVSRTTTLDIPSSTTSTGQAESGITGHYVTLYFNGNGSLVTYYNWVCHTASGHSGSDDWSIIGFTGLNCTGSWVTLAYGLASAGASDARSISAASGIKSIQFTYHVDDTHGTSCLSSDVNYSVTTLIPYNDVQP